MATASCGRSYAARHKQIFSKKNSAFKHLLKNSAITNTTDYTTETAFNFACIRAVTVDYYVKYAYIDVLQKIPASREVLAYLCSPKLSSRRRLLERGQCSLATLLIPTRTKNLLHAYDSTHTRSRN